MSRQRDKLGALSQALDEKLAEVTPKPRAPRSERTFIGGLTKAVLGSDELGRTLVEAREEGRLAVTIDPKQVRRSRFCNRLPISFEDEAFLRLKASIEKEGLRHPIKVRPVEGDSQFKYEVAAGQRRHQACLELGIPVIAIVRPMTDLELIREMDIENRERDNLSAYEEALQLQLWLDEGFYSNQAALVEKTRRSQSYVSALLRLLQFPEVVLDAFGDRRAIKVSWVQFLVRALKENEEGVLAIASSIPAKADRPKPDEVFKTLCSAPRPTPAPATRQQNAQAEKPKVLRYGRRRVLTLVKRNGGYQWRLDKQVPEDVAKKLHATIEEELIDLLEQAGAPK